MRITGKIKQNIPFAVMVGALLFLFGTPAHANVSASPAAVSFGNQAVGVASAPITVTVTNQGRGKIKIAPPSVSPTQFLYIGPTVPITLNPGQSLVASVQFTPAAAQTYTGTLVFTSQNGANITVPVSGAGIQVQPPTITTQPSSKSIVAGQTATFNVAATGTTPMTYQWMKNSAAISGATSSSYTTPGETTSDNNAQFAVMASNSMGNAASNAAVLTVNPAPVAPTITTQPASKTITTGQTATFSVAVTGTAPVSYQWSLNGAAISAANSSSYTTPTETTAGVTAQFTVTVTNSAGTATSNAAVLTVNPAPVVPTVGAVSPNNGPAAGGTAVTITGANFAAGATVTFGPTAASNVVVVNSTTITAKTPAGSAGAVTVTVTVSGQSGGLTNGFTYVVPATVSSVSPNSGSTAGGTAVTITGTNFAAGATVTFGSAAATNVVLVSGTQITATTPAGSAGAVTVTVTVIGQSGSLANGFTYTATVTVATPTFNRGAGTYGSAQSVSITSTTSGATICYTTNGSTPAANTPGTCSTGTALVNGGSVSVSISETLKAIGTESTFINSAVGSSSYTITTCVQNLAIGNYTLCGEAYNDISTGPSVSVSYSPSPGNGVIVWATWCFTSSCTTSISGVTATIGDNINATESCFAASPHSPFFTDDNGGAQGAGDFQQYYVWYCPSIPSGVTSFTMTPSNSSLSYLNLHISEWKAGSLAASCSPISACFENVDNSGQAGNTTGGTTATITTNGSTIYSNDLIFAVTQVPCCSFTSSPGTGYTGITVNPSLDIGMVTEAKAVTSAGTQTATTTWTGGNATWSAVIVPLIGAGGIPVAPTITTQPASKTITTGQTATFSVAATGTAPVSYQWILNGAAISAANSSSYTTPTETTAGVTAQFTVTVTNIAGTATSNPATLTVNAGTLLLNGSASALNFGNVTIPNTGTQTVTLTNAGNSSVTISGVSVTGPGFGASGVPTGLIMTPGQTATLTATFTPSATGSVTGSVAVASNASNSPDKITLSGTGVAVVNHSVALSWTASTSVVTGYNAYSSTTSGGPYTKLTSTPTPGTSYTDSTVLAGQTYYYVVTAVDSAGIESVYSTQISATIP